MNQPSSKLVLNLLAQFHSNQNIANSHLFHFRKVACKTGIRLICLSKSRLALICLMQLHCLLPVRVPIRPHLILCAKPSVYNMQLS